MKSKIIIAAILILIVFKNFAQTISSSSVIQVDSTLRNDLPVAIEQRQILYKQILNSDINSLSVNTEKNFMHSFNQQHMIDTNLVVPKRRSVWKSAGIGMAAGLATGAILGVTTANPDAFLGYSAGEGALAFGCLGAALGGISGLIVGVIQNVSSKNSH